MKLHFLRDVSAAVSAALFLASAFSASVSCSGPDTSSVSGSTMGTTWSVIFRDSMSAADAAFVKNHIQNTLDRVDSLMSTWKETSELSRFNRHASPAPFRVSDETLFVIRESIRINRLTEGAFDPGLGPLIELWGFGKKKNIQKPDAQTVQSIRKYASIREMKTEQNAIRKLHPKMTLNLSAIAKGYAVDLVTVRLKELGYDSFLAEVGGEIRTAGNPKNNEFWKIGIENPEYEMKRTLKRILHLKDISAATSGDYRNYFKQDGKIYAHILDPATGAPAERRIASATVVGPECITADALATALTVLGRDQALSVMEKFPGYEAYLIIKKESGFQEAMTPGMTKWIRSE